VTSDHGDDRPDYGRYYPREEPPTGPQGILPWESAPPEGAGAPWDAQQSRGAGQSWEETQSWTPPPPPPLPAPGPGQRSAQWGPPDQRPAAGGQGGHPGTGGYEGYATSRVYGAPRTPEGDQGGGTGGRRGRRRPGPVLITAIIAVLAVAAAAIIIFVVRGSNKPIIGFVPTGSTPDQDAQQLTAAFLTAWQEGQLAKAASYTDNPAAAQAAMTGFGAHLGLKKLTATYQSASGVAWPAGNSGSPYATGTAAPTTPREQVTYSAAARVAADYQGTAVAAMWTYHAKLIAYQVPGSPGWLIGWRPDVLAPNLTAATHLATVAVGPKVSQVTDNAGTDITTYGDAGLTHIGQLLAAQAPPGEGGSPGLNVELQKANGDPVQASQAQIVTPGDIPSLATTIDSKAEAAARSAVGMHKNSSMVIIQPSTGQIMAVANNAGSNDFALTAQVAPGSTMKVITSAALFNAGVLTPSSPVECPATVTITGITYHNDKNETLPAGTPFADDFAQSCNNAFTQQYTHLTGANSLAATAKTYFGLNTKWNIGIPGVSASYFNAPSSATGSELAQEAFGEGQLTASPIAMASVAATVAAGRFHQPILLEHAKQVTATPLPANTVSSLKQVMRAVVTGGTATGLGFGPNVYAKTGTASIKGQEQPNSWLIAFDSAKDIAVACLVTNAGYGAQVAGPEVASVLSKM